MAIGTSTGSFGSLITGSVGVSPDVGALSRNDISLTRAVGALTGKGKVLKADDDSLTSNIGTLTFDDGGLTFDVFGRKHVGNRLFDSAFRRKQQKHT